MKIMKKVTFPVIWVAILLLSLLQESVSAQLFQRLARNLDDENQTSTISKINRENFEKTVVAEIPVISLSEDLRNEMIGRASVRPVPDFMSDAPLAKAAKQFKPPIIHTSQRPGNLTDNHVRIQPPQMVLQQKPQQNQLIEQTTYQSLHVENKNNFIVPAQLVERKSNVSDEH
jgi:hypothetical protein